MMGEFEQKILLKRNENILLLLLLIIVLVVGMLIILIFSSKSISNEKELKMDDISVTKQIGKKIVLDNSINNIYFNVLYPEIGIEELDVKIYSLINNKLKNIEDNYKDDSYIVEYYYFLDYEIYVGNGNIISLVLKDRLIDTYLDLKEVNDEVYYYSLDNYDSLSNSDIFSDSENIGIYDNTKYIINNDKIIIGDKEILLKDVEDSLNIEVYEGKDYNNDISDIVIDMVNKEKGVIQDIVVYDRCSIDGKIIGTILKNDKVKVYGMLNNGYSVILYDNKLGYVDSRYLTDVIEVVKNDSVMEKEVIEIEETTMYVLDSVSLKNVPSNNGENIAILKYGDVVLKNGYIDDWSRVKYNGKEGYVKSNSLTTNKIIKHTIPNNVEPQGDIDINKPMVAITFDDGPSNVSTPKILDVFEKYNAKATFFDLGTLMEKYPEISKREAEIGEVGTHTYSHKNLNTLNINSLNEEINKAKDIYKDVLGEDVKLIRPPYGNANGFVKSNILDMAIINWNVDTLDWKYRNKDMVLNEIDKYGDLNGKIILMHSIYDSTAQAVEILVPELISKGYQLVTISEMAYYRNYTLETGTIYYSFK